MVTTPHRRNSNFCPCRLEGMPDERTTRQLTVAAAAHHGSVTVSQIRPLPLRAERDAERDRRDRT